MSIRRLSCTRTWQRLLLATVITLVSAAVSASPLPPAPSLYLSFDGSDQPVVSAGTAEVARGAVEDALLLIHQRDRRTFPAGKVGQAYDADTQALFYRVAGNFRADEGTAAVWLKPHYDGTDTTTYSAFFGAGRWGMVYKYSKHTHITFGTARPERDLYYDCNSKPITHWKRGEWHHVAVTWSRSRNQRCIYLDGELSGQAPFPHHVELGDGLLHVGGGCAMYPRPVARALVDEVGVWDRALAAPEVKAIWQRGDQGLPLTDRPGEATDAGKGPPGVALPDDPETLSTADVSPTRQAISLAGAWRFCPATGQAPRDANRWGRSNVPGICWDSGVSHTPDGKPVRREWLGRKTVTLDTVAYSRQVIVPTDWRGRTILLECDGVGGLAEWFVNGKSVGELPHWEGGSFEITDLLQPGKSVRISVLLQKTGRIRQFGIYGDVRLAALPRASVQGLLIDPRLTADTSTADGVALLPEPRLEILCKILNRGPSSRATLAFTIDPVDGSAGKPKQFRHAFALRSAGPGRDIRAVEQSIACSFAWPLPVLWTYDRPFLYRVRAELLLDDQRVDVAAPITFGFREFRTHGADFLLNGVPTHLRGHQINLAWGPQMPKVEELREAGMNCFEFAGPVSAQWYKDRPCFPPDFEAILDYADQHGLIAAVSLPGAKVLRETLLDSDVGARYQRRIESFVRRYGNHPSVCLWYMHFNWAGYRWYHPPDKSDGSYKPDDSRFREKERFALRTEELIRGVDRRPIYHHACGNLGEIFSLNCYIGPTSPLQEREEWPSRWAEKRPFPLFACEHGLMLIPYWFRPRQFPLSVVYADEPLFDEIAAKYLGDRAYAALTPELFARYDLEREKPRSDRTRALIKAHPGYQEVKSLFARHSFRAWRTYGVSGIVFNAINWDYYTGDNKPSRVLKALGRYFDHTDMYIAGPPGNWPTKDHSFFAGETIGKQIVLLNDLTRDVPVSLLWALRTVDGRQVTRDAANAVAAAGKVTFVPIEFTAPQVERRTECVLSVVAEGAAAQHFVRDDFSLQVFPDRMAAPPGSGAVLVHDPHGRTSRILDGMGIQVVRWTGGEDLTQFRLLVAGERGYDDRFRELAENGNLSQAIADGLNVLVFEQAAGNVFGVRIEEQSARRVFVRQPGHPFLAGLAASDFVDLRGESDLMPPYPPAPAETSTKWPTRYFKWGNRGVVASYVCRKPHVGPFSPVLECGFDLVDSPLLAARLGRGRVVLCQVDVTARAAADPVSRRLVDNLLRELRKKALSQPASVRAVGAGASEVARMFRLRLAEPAESGAGLILVGRLERPSQESTQIRAAVRAGATALLLPDADAPTAAAFGLRLSEQTLFRGEIRGDDQITGIGNSDLYLKTKVTVSVAAVEGGWQEAIAPGLVVSRRLGRGRLIACRLPLLDAQTRAGVKTTRCWNSLLNSLSMSRENDAELTTGKAVQYLDSPWEEIPPFINW